MRYSINPCTKPRMTRSDKSIPVEKIWQIYLVQKSVWKVGNILGLAGQTVYEKLKKAGYKLLRSNWNTDEINKLESYYKNTNSLDFDIKVIANILKRPYFGVAIKASKLGLSNGTRRKSKKTCQKMGERVRKWHEQNPHPRGSLGLKHTTKTRKILSEKSLAAHKNRPKEKEAERIMKMLKTRQKNGTLIPKNQKVSWKQAWHVIGGKRHYFRSSWEVNYAHYLQWLKERNEITEWNYEIQTFWFDKIKRGVRSYTPDFQIVELNDDVVFHEIKGWMDDKSKTKIKRMAKYYPEIKLIVIDSKAYKKLCKQLSRLVPGWSQ